MNSDRSPLVNKLILLVLSLIFVCLVLLVIRAYDRGSKPEQTAAAPAVEEPVMEEAPTPVEPPPAPLRPVVKRLPVANTPRVAPSVRLPAEAQDAPVFAEDRPMAPVVAPGVNLPGGSTGRTGGTVGGGTSPNPARPEIVGTVSLLGTPPAEIPIELGPSCGRLRRAPVTTRHFVVSPEGGLANVFVSLGQGVEGGFISTGPAPPLDQIRCMFEPYVFGVQTNQKFFVQNSDPELHNLHFTPRLNRERNIAQPAGKRLLEFNFPKPEPFIRIKCDVHPWMFAYVSVVEHPFFAVTDTNGLFRLPTGFPAGRYVVTAMHLKAGTLSQEVILAPGEQKAIEFQFAVPGTFTPQSRVVRRE
jgi:hypothetical protein